MIDPVLGHEHSSRGEAMNLKTTITEQDEREASKRAIQFQQQQQQNQQQHPQQQQQPAETAAAATVNPTQPAT